MQDSQEKFEVRDEDVLLRAIDWLMWKIWRLARAAWRFVAAEK